MDIQKEKFLRNEFLTMSVNGALGRSRTYSKSASKEAKDSFRNTLRENLDEVSKSYKSIVTEKDHLSNIKYLSDDLTLHCQNCLRDGRFRIGIAQKALNLYLKYLWCVKLIEQPPHCPFDSIVISYLQDCNDLNWTSIDNLEDYTRLVNAAKKVADGKSLSEWELEIWLNSVQFERQKGDKRSCTYKGKERTREDEFQPVIERERGAMIKATVTSQGPYADNKDKCELLISRESSDMLPHEYEQKKNIDMIIGDILYEAGVHETQNGDVWISSVLLKKEPRREKVRLVDALTAIGLQRGDKVRIATNTDGTFLLQTM